MNIKKLIAVCLSGGIVIGGTIAFASGVDIGGGGDSGSKVPAVVNVEATDGDKVSNLADLSANITSFTNAANYYGGGVVSNDIVPVQIKYETTQTTEAMSIEQTVLCSYTKDYVYFDSTSRTTQTAAFGTLDISYDMDLLLDVNGKVKTSISNYTYTLKDNGDASYADTVTLQKSILDTFKKQVNSNKKWIAVEGEISEEEGMAFINSKKTEAEQQAAAVAIMLIESNFTPLYTNTIQANESNLANLARLNKIIAMEDKFTSAGNEYVYKNGSTNLTINLENPYSPVVSYTTTNITQKMTFSHINSVNFSINDVQTVSALALLGDAFAAGPGKIYVEMMTKGGN